MTVKPVLQRLKPLRFSYVYVVAEATTYKDTQIRAINVAAGRGLLLGAAFRWCLRKLLGRGRRGSSARHPFRANSQSCRELGRLCRLRGWPFRWRITLRARRLSRALAAWRHRWLRLGWFVRYLLHLRPLAWRSIPFLVLLDRVILYRVARPRSGSGRGRLRLLFPCRLASIGWLGSRRSGGRKFFFAWRSAWRLPGRLGLLLRIGLRCRCGRRLAIPGRFLGLGLLRPGDFPRGRGNLAAKFRRCGRGAGPFYLRSG